MKTKHIIRWIALSIANLFLYTALPAVLTFLLWYPPIFKMTLSEGGMADYEMYGSYESTVLAQAMGLMFIAVFIGTIIALIPIFFISKKIAPTHKEDSAYVAAALFGLFPAIVILLLIVQFIEWLIGK